MAMRKAITLITILKKEASNEDDKCINFLVIKLVRAIQNAPPKTNKTPINDTDPLPKGSAEIMTPKKPNKIAKIRTKLILSLKKKCDKTNSIKGELKRTGYTTDNGNLITPINTSKNPRV